SIDLFISFNYYDTSVFTMHRLTARTRISRPGPVLSWVRTRMGRDFFSVGWDRTRFFFGGMRQDRTFFQWDGTGPDSFFMGWDRTEFLFCGMGQDQILFWWDG